MTYSDKPCSESAEKVETTDSGSGSDDSWTFINHTDEMTGEQSCFAKSPNFYLGRQGNDWLFASLRVGGTEEKPLVILRSESSFDPKPTSIHNDIEGLGLKVDGRFFEVSASSGSYIAGFNYKQSAKILEKLNNSSGFRARLRFWPYEQTYDSEKKGLQGFRSAFRKASRCNASG